MPKKSNAISKMNEVMLEKILGYTFKDKEILQRALTHPSYFAEKQENYQKLEFLGDSILEFVVAEYLYNHFAYKNEGELSKLRAAIVSKSALSKLIIEMGVDKFMLVGSFQKSISGKMRSDIYEAIIAAIYLDGGIDEAKRFISTTIIKKLSTADADYKSKILEYAAKNALSMHFDTKGKGPSHKMRFFSTVYLANKALGSGEGNSKKEAEQNASRKALEQLNIH